MITVEKIIVEMKGLSNKNLEAAEKNMISKERDQEYYGGYVACLQDIINFIKNEIE